MPLSHRHDPAEVRIRIMYLLMCFFCGFVSAFDNVLNFITMETLESEEQNPLASMFILAYGIPMFIYIKALGTMASVAIMFLLVYSKYRVAVVGVFIFQLLLLFYLNFYSSHNLLSLDMFTVSRMVIDFYIQNT